MMIMKKKMRLPWGCAHCLVALVMQRQFVWAVLSPGRAKAWAVLPTEEANECPASLEIQCPTKGLPTRRTITAVPWASH